MRVETGDLWDCHAKGFWVVVPSNAFGVSGRGVAAQARDKFPEAAKWWRDASEYLSWGLWKRNHLFWLPVKRHWRNKADPALISMALDGLDHYRNEMEDAAPGCALPLLGAGFGELPNARARALIDDAELSNFFTLVLRASEVRRRYPESFRPASRIDRSKGAKP